MLKIAWSPIYAHPLPAGHRFPMIKYELLPEQLLYEGTVTEDHFFSPFPLEEKYITAIHQPAYWKKLQTLSLNRKEERRTGFPLSAKLVEREITIAQGSIQTALYALEYGISMNIAGGTHHAYPDHGEGFCLLNDIAIASHFLLSKGLAKQILVVDLDVHQGNGTAAIFKDNQQVFTFSMHGARNYPLHKEVSDLDIGLVDGTGDTVYLQQLKTILPRLIEQLAPDFIFYQAGVDVLATDKLGRLGLSREGCRQRDHYVLTSCKKHSIPIAVSMGGGYSERISDIVEAHANTFRLAQEIFF